ncbi:hypothetical protein HU200_063463 [Digitaria exilis]|uniref:Uncharacterized protein n=1 Tax=Digitaria exilis TaxID=1010633 RepID=A0A835DYZ1_9POAL|nr:hypothetical protein HU200_063463 [Digitaria exilis]
MDVHGRIARAISDALRDPEKLPEALILCGVLEAYGVLLAAVVFGVVEAFTGFWVSGDLAGRRRTVGVIVLWFSVLLVIIIAEAFLLRRQSSSCLGVRDTPCFAIATWGLQCFVNWSFAFFCSPNPRAGAAMYRPPGQSRTLAPAPAPHPASLAAAPLPHPGFLAPTGLLRPASLAPAGIPCPASFALPGFRRPASPETAAPVSMGVEASGVDFPHLSYQMAQATV